MYNRTFLIKKVSYLENFFCGTFSQILVFLLAWSALTATQCQQILQQLRRPGTDRANEVFKHEYFLKTSNVATKTQNRIWNASVYARITHTVDLADKPLSIVQRMSSCLIVNFGSPTLQAG